LPLPLFPAHLTQELIPASQLLPDSLIQSSSPPLFVLDSQADSSQELS
jgi:hypothetical protein